MAGINQFSMKSKLMTLLMGVSLGSVLLLGILSWVRLKAVFQTQVFEHLTSVRSSKGREVEAYITNLRDYMKVLSEDRTMVAAMVNFSAAYRALQNESIPNDWIETIETYYARDFLPALAENVEGPQIVANYRPLSQASQYLQYHYVANSAASDEGVDTVTTDSSGYAQQHAIYHPIFQNLIDTFGYGDLYLIDFNSGEIVYSVNKRPDYATSLDRGPYRRSSLADVVEAVRDNPGRGFVQVVDFEPYVPNLVAPAAFFAAPIFNGPHIVGIVALQLPPERLNDILVGTQNWVDEGLGETGQVYLVGEDAQMRSVSRELLEDADTYRETLRRVGLSAETVDLVYDLNTSVLLQPVETKATQAAMAGESGTEIIQDYKGTQVVSAYAPLRLEGLRWAVLAEMDKTEALGATTMMQIYMSTIAVIIVLVAALLAQLAAHAMVNPIRRLIMAGDKLQKGEPLDNLPSHGTDEVGQLGASFKHLAQTLNERADLVSQKSSENEALLKNILPETVATRFRQGEDSIADEIQQATVLLAKIGGLDQEDTSEIAAAAFSTLISEFNRIVKRTGFEPQSMADTTYLAVCGLSAAYFDQQERGIKVAQAMLKVLQAVNDRYQSRLHIQIGVHSGAITAGVVGSDPFTYKLWGRTIEIATQLPEQAEPNQIVVSQPIYERLKDRHHLLAHGSVIADDVESLTTWHLVTDKVPVGSSA